MVILCHSFGVLMLYLLVIFYNHFSPSGFNAVNARLPGIYEMHTSSSRIKDERS